ncbi:hypothetical protein EAO72_07625 [Streptomyces sp. or43]|nr:hypothetical protein EAO72_07625 [Streptomyces sp. or43]
MTRASAERRDWLSTSSAALRALRVGRQRTGLGGHMAGALRSSLSLWALISAAIRLHSARSKLGDAGSDTDSHSFSSALHTSHFG